MRRGLALCLAAAGLLVALGGCVRSDMYIVARQAEAKLAEAEKLGAAQSAPYEFEAAKQWLKFSKHENDESDGEGLMIAKKALEYADAALAKAKGGAK